MQQQHPPVSPTSSVLMMGAAANVASERRNHNHHYRDNNNSSNNNKSLMNYFRDRSTPSYSRSNSRSTIIVRSADQRQTEAATVHNKEPTSLTSRPRAVHNKLTLLKSSSTRDLSRLMEMEPLSASTAYLTSSSSSSSEQQRFANCNAGGCLKYVEELEKRVSQFDQELQDQRVYAKHLESRLDDVTRRVEELTTELKHVVVAKNRKKLSPNSRKKTSNATTNPSGDGSGGNVQQSKLTAWMNLSNWWKHRPSIATLKEQSIYKDEPCFDTEIESVLKHEIHKTVPKIVVDCCDLIEEKYRKSSEPVEGIYRQCGDYNKIQTLRFSIDANDYEALGQPKVDIHTLTGVLKLFLREIKSPLVSTNEAKTFIGKPNQWLLTELPAKIDTLKRLIRSLPEVNRDTMEYLFTHFNKLTKVPLQQISAETLSLSVTPSIFHAVQQGGVQDLHDLLKESEIMADCVKILIEYQSRIFECTGERRRRLLSVRQLRKTLSHPDLLFQNLF